MQLDNILTSVDIAYLGFAVLGLAISILILADRIDQRNKRHNKKSSS